jgi:hypothetical protein
MFKDYKRNNYNIKVNFIKNIFIKYNNNNNNNNIKVI